MIIFTAVSIQFDDGSRYLYMLYDQVRYHMAVGVTVLLVVFVASVALIAHAYFLYPLFLYLLAAVLPDGDGDGEFPEAETTLPSVALVIAAYNEEAVIEEKIENSLELNYPGEKLNIIVFSDASSDQTDAIVRSYADAGIELIRIEGRVGKTECQNRVAAAVDAEVLVFSDANSMYEPDAIRSLVSRFDDGVGCVVGELRYRQTTDGVEGESLYWRYARFIKRLESKIGSVVKGNGAVYAVRREEYVPLPPDTMSDFAEPLTVRVSGAEVKYEPRAVAWEHTAGSIKAEQSRKIRIITRSWYTISRYRSIFNPFEYGWYALQVFTDTVLWWSMPILSLIAFGSATLLAVLTGSLIFAAVTAACVGLLLLGSIGFYLDRLRGADTIPAIFHVPHYFLVVNHSLLVGLWSFFYGKNIISWETSNE